MSQRSSARDFNQLDNPLSQEDYENGNGHNNGNGGQHAFDDLPQQKLTQEQQDQKKHNERLKKKNEQATIPVISLYGLFKFATPTEKFLCALATVGSGAQGVALPALFLIFGQVINFFTASVECLPSQIFNSVSGGGIGRQVLPFVYIGIGTLFTGYCTAGVSGVMSVRVARIWRLKYLQALMYQDIEFFDTESTPGSLLASLNEDTLNIEQALGQQYGTFWQFICMFASGIIIAIVKVWQVGLVMFAAVPALLVSLVALILIQAGLQIRRNKLYEGADDIVQQYITQIRTVVSYNAQSKVLEQFKAAVVKPTKLGYRQGFYEGLGVGSINLSLFGINALGWWFGGNRLRRGIIHQAGDVLIAVFAVIIGGFSLAQIAPPLIFFNRGIAAKQRMLKTIQHIPRIDSRAPGNEPDDVTGDVELRDVSFAYPARPDYLVFKHFSLKIPNGITAALVGQSGSGKSTIVQLVQRFYDPTFGQVLIDGIDMRQYQLRSIRRFIGLVNQEPILFSGTIRDNIVQGKLGASAEEVIEAAKNANVHEFIDSLPEKYETSVGARGVSLSGGQKQRIAIARAMLKNPKILLLDEATSALDNKSEVVVQAALNKLSVGRTTIVVAHRLSTIRNSNVIAVIREGEMVELGSHDQLIQKPEGFYTNLVKIQLAAGELEVKQDGYGVGRNRSIKQDRESFMKSRRQMNQESFRAQYVENMTSSLRGVSGLMPQGSLRAFSQNEPAFITSLANSMRGGSIRENTRQNIYADPNKPEMKEMEVQTSFKMDFPPEKKQGKSIRQMFRPKPKNAEKLKEPKAKKEKKPKVKVFGRMMKLIKKQHIFILLGVITSVITGAQQPSQAILVPRAVFALMFQAGGYICQFDAGFCPCPNYYEIQAGLMTTQEAANQVFARYVWLNNVVVIVYAALAGGNFFAGMIQKFSFTLVGTKLAEKMREILLAKILQQEIAFFDDPENSVGALAQRLSTDALLIRGAVGDVLGAMVQEVCNVLGCLVVAFIAGGSAWKLTLVVLACLPLFAGAMMLEAKLNSGLAADSGDDYAQANNIATESAFNIRLVQSFILEEDVTNRYGKSLMKPYHRAVKQSSVNGITQGVANFIQFGINALGLWYGGQLLSRGELTVQQLFQSFFGITFIGQGLAIAQIQFPEVNKGRPAAERILKIVDRKPEIDAESEDGQKLDNVQGQIEYKHINFVYPTRKEVTVFENFSLKCNAGEVTAMVGESGSGKSTVISLLERFYNPTKGTIYLDKVDIRQLNLKWLRDSMALVSQEPVLFSTTLIENIRIGKPDVTHEEALQACQVANILDFVQNLPEKLDTIIGEKGIRLSGGQKQRIAIARAVVKNTKILLLDEATSALDANSEHAVQEALDRISQNRTTITIAHRLSTIRNAHKIAVVQRGKLQEQGTHEVLMRIPDGVYKGLVAAQEKKKQ